MSTLLAIILTVVAALLLVPTGVFFIEVLMAAVARTPVARVPDETERPRIAILVPAHNEASIIAATIGSITPQLHQSDRLLVVADNCSDETGELATSLGATVVVRTDQTRRGKGYALDFGVRHLEADPPGIVVIMDADCHAAPGCIDRLAKLSLRSGRPVQALYLMHAPAGASVKTRIAEFAWLVKNQVRPLGLRTLGFPCQLMGTGMAFPWQSLRTANLASGHIVEDLKLGLDLARAGGAPLFCPDALVTSQFPISTEGVQSQRTRWEHGHLGVILAETPALLFDAVARWRGDLFALALDLCVPPLSFLVLLTAAVWFASALLFAFAHTALPLGIATVAVSLLVASVAFSWLRYGHRIISLGTLLYAAVYALWKIPIYAKFLVARQMSWVRSKRDADR